MKLGKTEKAVFAKLASQKVELSSLDDLNAATKKMQAVNNDYESFVRGANDIMSDIRKLGTLIRSTTNRKDAILKELISSYNDVKASMKALASASKELGVDAKSIKEYRAADQFLGIIETRLNYLKKEFDSEIASELKNLI